MSIWVRDVWGLALKAAFETDLVESLNPSLESRKINRISQLVLFQPVIAVKFIWPSISKNDWVAYNTAVRKQIYKNHEKYSIKNVEKHKKKIPYIWHAMQKWKGEKRTYLYSWAVSDEQTPSTFLCQAAIILPDSLVIFCPPATSLKHRKERGQHRWERGRAGFANP